MVLLEGKKRYEKEIQTILGRNDMKKKHILIIISIIIVVIIGIIIGINIHKNNMNKENTKAVVKTQEVKVNPTTTIQKPKMLTETELAEKEKEAAAEWKIREKRDKKYVTLEEVEDYIATKSTALLIKEFPNEKVNEDVLNNKMKELLKTTITEKVIKEKFELNGPKYDLNQFDVEITPIDDLKFALNINTDKLIPNSNKDISIVRTFSAE